MMRLAVTREEFKEKTGLDAPTGCCHQIVDHGDRFVDYLFIDDFLPIMAAHQVDELERLGQLIDPRP